MQFFHSICHRQVIFWGRWNFFKVDLKHKFVHFLFGSEHIPKTTCFIACPADFIFYLNFFTLVVMPHVFVFYCEAMWSTFGWVKLNKDKRRSIDCNKTFFRASTSPASSLISASVEKRPTFLLTLQSFGNWPETRRDVKPRILESSERFKPSTLIPSVQLKKFLENHFLYHNSV